MTRIEVVAEPANSDTIRTAEAETLYPHPAVAALFAEVDAILCAALDPAHYPPAPLATGRALMRPRLAGRSLGVLVRPWTGPVHRARAVQRSPPGYEPPATKINDSV